MLKNGNFEADWSEEKSHRCLVFPGGEQKNVGNIFTPAGWLTWFRHKAGTWAQPEVRDAWKSGDARRVHEGEKATLLFTFQRKHDAGLLQQVQVAPGAKLKLTAWAHAWSNHEDKDQPEAFPHPDDGRWSEGAGYDEVAILVDNVPPLNGKPQNDALGNFLFVVGIDPAGGTNPDAETVVWGEAKAIYNGYVESLEVKATAQASMITVFLRSTTLWAFKHNDAYWDDVELTVISEPEPEPEPLVKWDYPVIETGSKLGIHGIHSGDVLSYIDTLAQAGTYFPVVKAVDDLGWLVEVKQKSPETIIIARLTDPDFEKGHDFSQGVATHLIGRILSQSTELRDVVDYWEMINEPLGGGTGPDKHRQLARLMDYMMDEAKQHDLKLAMPAFNAGQPEWADMVAMAETGVFARMKAGEHILTAHEGTFGLDDPVNLYYGDLIPGAPLIDGAGALNRRYRYLYHLLKQRGEVVPLVISEWWGIGPLSTTQAVEGFCWYDDKLSEDYYVLACCPFTVGPTNTWKYCDWGKHYPRLLDHVIEVKNRQNALPPEPQPSQPCRGAPRVQYERTVILLPPTADNTWAHAVVDATWDSHRYSILPSADDAGIGDLDVRRIIAVNPGDWPGDLEAFYQEHYPGVEVVSVDAASPVELLALLSEAL